MFAMEYLRNVKLAKYAFKKQKQEDALSRCSSRVILLSSLLIKLFTLDKGRTIMLKPCKFMQIIAQCRVVFTVRLISCCMKTGDNSYLFITQN